MSLVVYRMYLIVRCQSSKHNCLASTIEASFFFINVYNYIYGLMIFQDKVNALEKEVKVKHKNNTTSLSQGCSVEVVDSHELEEELPTTTKNNVHEKKVVGIAHILRRKVDLVDPGTSGNELAFDESSINMDEDSFSEPYDDSDVDSLYKPDEDSDLHDTQLR